MRRSTRWATPSSTRTWSEPPAGCGRITPSDAPAARAIATDTRLPLARQFDATAALERLGRDGRRLARAPRPVGFLRRIISDGPVRRLFVAVAVAAALGGYIAWGS